MTLRPLLVYSSAVKLSWQGQDSSISSLLWCFNYRRPQEKRPLWFKGLPNTFENCNILINKDLLIAKVAKGVNLVCGGICGLWKCQVPEVAGSVFSRGFLCVGTGTPLRPRRVVPLSFCRGGERRRSSTPRRLSVYASPFVLCTVPWIDQVPVKEAYIYIHIHYFMHILEDWLDCILSS